MEQVLGVLKVVDNLKDEIDKRRTDFFENHQ
jgi:hypothetical protein